VFALGNLAYDVCRFVQPQPAPSAFSCPGGEAAVTQLLTRCFYGAFIFLSAFDASTLIHRTCA